MVALPGGPRRLHLRGDAAGTWSRLSPWCSVRIEPTGFSFFPLGQKPNTTPRDRDQLCSPNCPCVVRAKTETFRGGLAGGGTGWGASLCMDKNPLSSNTSRPSPEAGVVEGRETKIHAVFLETPLAPPKSALGTICLLPPSQECSGSSLWTSHTAVKGPVWGGTWDLVLPTVCLVTGSAGGPAPTRDCSPFSGRNLTQKASPGAAWSLLSAEPGSGKDGCVCVRVCVCRSGGETRLLVFIPHGSCPQNKN